MADSTARDEAIADAVAAVLAHRWRRDDEGYAHREHVYDGSCAVCRGDIADVLAVALDALSGDVLVRLATDKGALQRVGYVSCGRREFEPSIDRYRGPVYRLVVPPQPETPT